MRSLVLYIDIGRTLLKGSEEAVKLAADPEARSAVRAQEPADSRLAVVTRTHQTSTQLRAHMQLRGTRLVSIKAGVSRLPPRADSFSRLMFFD
jgi:hypothetical protein